MRVQGLAGFLTNIRRRGRSTAVMPLLFLAVWGCGSSDPGTFEFELSVNSLDIPVGDTDDVLVQIRCGTNTKKFIVQVSVEGAPTGLTFQVPAPGTVNCQNGDPNPSPMSVTPEGIGEGIYDVTVVAINYNEKDLLLVEPGVRRELPFTVNITP